MPVKVGWLTAHVQMLDFYRVYKWSVYISQYPKISDVCKP